MSHLDICFLYVDLLILVPSFDCRLQLRSVEVNGARKEFGTFLRALKIAKYLFIDDDLASRPSTARVLSYHSFLTQGKPIVIAL